MGSDYKTFKVSIRTARPKILVYNFTLQKIIHRESEKEDTVILSFFILLVLQFRLNHV